MNKQILQNKRPYILITNDDGVHAPGIRFLWETLKSQADLIVIAPHVDQSGMGLSITLRKPLHVYQTNWGNREDSIWSVTGTPADCVKLGLSTILQRKPDLIVSGINRGSNLGRNLLYSGTVGAAIEGALQDIPSIAFSCLDEQGEPNFHTAAQYTPHIIEHLLTHPLPEGSLLNVNFPEVGNAPFKGFKMTSQGADQVAENPEKRTHPVQGNPYYWLGAQPRPGKGHADCDDFWIKQGYITAVPVHVANLTDWSHLNGVREHFESAFPV